MEHITHTFHTMPGTMGIPGHITSFEPNAYNTHHSHTTDSALLVGPSASLMHNIPKQSVHMSTMKHFDDCDTNYPVKQDPIQNIVCNKSEANHFMDDTRKCLIDEKNQGIGAVKRHIDCWGQAVKDSF